MVQQKLQMVKELHREYTKNNTDKNSPPSLVNELSNLRPLWATTRTIDGIVYEGNLNRPKK